MAEQIYRTRADHIYKRLLEQITLYGDIVSTRNAVTKSHINLQPVTFHSAPLITVRKTAWKKALKEMEWFLSGNNKCPDELLDWWKGQLNEHNELVAGYGEQFRRSTFDNYNLDMGYVLFDQIDFIQKALRNNPNSRRLILTSWNPGEMANITAINDNPNTPTSCHNTMTQFFVRGGTLHMKTYQRSADMLLGVPHNWIQSWAMLVWFAYNADLEVGSMTWTFGDAHIYQEESHVEVAKEIINYQYPVGVFNRYDLLYTPMTTDFKADAFSILKDIPEPVTKIRPKLL